MAYAHLICHRFVDNRLRLCQLVLDFDVGNFVRRLILPESVKNWSPRSVQTRLIKKRGRLVRHARRLAFQLADVAVSRALIQRMLERIGPDRVGEVGRREP